MHRMRCPSPRLPVTLLCLAAGAAAQTPTRLEGLVLDPLSQPVANARLTAELDGATLAETRSDASGTFVFANLPERVFVVRATTEAPDVGAVLVDLAAQPRGFAMLRTMPARRVHGTVRGADGNPVAGAWISCTPLTAAAFATAASATTSDERGDFELTHVPFGRAALRVWATERAGFAATIEGIADTRQDCALPDEEAAERGFRVVDATPAQLATVRIAVTATHTAIELMLPSSLRQPAPGADGVFVVRGWPRSDRMLARLHSASFALDPAEACVEADLPDRVKQVYVVGDGDGATVRGRLTSAEGMRVGNVRLAVGDASRSQVVETAGDGSFVFPSPVARGETFWMRCLDRERTLRVEGQRIAYRGHAFPGLVRFQHSPRRTHTIELRAARAVRARLVDEKGAPVVGAEVRLLGTQRQQVSGGKVGGKTMNYTQAPVYALVHSGLDGSVEIRGMDLDPDTDLVLQAIGPGWFAEEPFALVDAVEDLGAIRLRPAGALVGHVLSADARPGPGAHLRVENPAGCWREVFAACDRAGAFAITDLLPGPCRTGIADRPHTETVDNAVAGRSVDVTLVQ